MISATAYRHRPRGSVYLIVLSVSVLVTVIGIASLFAVRVQRRSAEIARDCGEARLYAQSAVELGLLYVQDPNWRNTYLDGTWHDMPIGAGHCFIVGTDPNDGILNNGDNDPLVLAGLGIAGLASQRMQVRLEAEADFATIEKRVAAGNDDAEERSSDGAMILNGPGLEMAYDDDPNNLTDTVAMRFTSVAIPQGAAVASAYVQFEVDETGSSSASLTVRGEDVDDAAAFSSTANDITSRTVTTAEVAWSPSAWTVVGEAGNDQRTPDLASIIQEIIDRPGWTSGNTLVIIITGSGTRTAEAYDGDPAGAPLLHVEAGISMIPVSGSWEQVVN